MGMSVVCFLCAVFLLIAGSRSGQLSLLGGSGVTGLLWIIFWVYHLKKEAAPENPQLPVQG